MVLGSNISPAGLHFQFAYSADFRPSGSQQLGPSHPVFFPPFLLALLLAFHSHLFRLKHMLQGYWVVRW